MMGSTSAGAGTDSVAIGAAATVGGTAETSSGANGGGKGAQASMLTSAAVGSGFNGGSEGIMNGSGAVGNVDGMDPTAAIGGIFRGGSPGIGNPPTPSPGRPPAVAGKFMKLKSGMVGAGICIPDCNIDPLPVVVDIIKGMENGTEFVEGNTGIVGAPDIKGDGSTGAFGNW